MPPTTLSVQVVSVVGGVQGPTTNLEKINIFPTSPPPLVPPVTQDIFRMNWKKKTQLIVNLSLMSE